jgi:hypothetical protein
MRQHGAEHFSQGESWTWFLSFSPGVVASSIKSSTLLQGVRRSQPLVERGPAKSTLDPQELAVS